MSRPVRSFRSITFRGATYRVSLSHPLIPPSRSSRLVSDIIRRLRLELERYVGRYPEFASSLAPLGSAAVLPRDPPKSAVRMHEASLRLLASLRAVAMGGGGPAGGAAAPGTRAAGSAGQAASDRLAAAGLSPVGPMAAVAGTIAELTVEELLSAVADEGGDPSEADVVVENGGDIACQLLAPLTVGVYAGPASPFSRLAFLIPAGGGWAEGAAWESGGPEQPHIPPPPHEPLRLAVCSSSGRMGHSLSFGSCELATVFSRSASLADAAATALCNCISSARHLQTCLETVMGVEGVKGAVAIHGGRFASAGRVPQLVTHRDPELQAKVSRADR